MFEFGALSLSIIFFFFFERKRTKSVFHLISNWLVLHHQIGTCHNCQSTRVEVFWFKFPNINLPFKWIVKYIKNIICFRNTSFNVWQTWKLYLKHNIIWCDLRFVRLLKWTCTLTSRSRSKSPRHMALVYLPLPVTYPPRTKRVFSLAHEAFRDIAKNKN